MCLSRITEYFRRSKHEREQRELYERIEQDIKWRRAGRRGGIRVATKRGGPNMPVFQPCPECHANSKRGAKTEGGAYYICRTHREFFVRRDRRIPTIPVAQHSK